MRKVSQPPGPRSDYAHAAAVGLFAFAVYLLTACRTLSDGDSAEIAAATAVFGVPHPPGYPLYTLLTGTLARLLPLDPAHAANVVTGLWAALAVASLWGLA